MNWMIPDVEPYVRYIIQEFTRWSGANVLTLTILTNILTILKAWAVKSEKATDDKIITLLLYFFSFKWLKSATETTDKK